MTEDLIAMALEVDPMGKDGRLYSMAILTPETIERFAALVRADAVARTREACAKVCDEQAAKWTSPKYHYAQAVGVHCAAAIRALGERT